MTPDPSPDILFLDEPTTGIDVASARQLRQLVQALNKNGTTIFLTTHYIEAAERLCDRIAFIVSGRTVRTDKVDNLIQPVRGEHTLPYLAGGPGGSGRFLHRPVCCQPEQHPEAVDCLSLQMRMNNG